LTAIGRRTRAGRKGTTARWLGPALRPRQPIFPEPVRAATRAHGVITAATATVVERPPMASLGARGGESDGESTGEARRSRWVDGWGSGRL
jgi:hypothetical protein